MPTAPPPLAPAKALWTGASVPTRRRSLRLPRGTGGAAATTSEPPHAVASAAEPQREATAATAAMTISATVPLALSAPTPVGGDQPTVVVIADDDAPPPGWDQWMSPPAPASEPPVGVLMMREDGTVMSGRPTHGAGTSSSRAALPASGSTETRLEQGQEHTSAPPAHLDDTEEDQALWQELRDHGSSLNRALNDALRIHSGPAWRVFQVRDCLLSFAVLPFSFLPRPRFP
jgi:hypothetical protein